MKIFVSWSGERSGSIAKSLKSWLPKVVQHLQPWLSSESISAGVRWSDALAGALQELRFGVLCLTPENLGSAWVMFEAGALSKIVSESRVIPYLLDVKPKDLRGPLAQFQAVSSDEDGTFRLLQSINLSGEQALSAEA